jgi:hypothetical protein
MSLTTITFLNYSCNIESELHFLITLKNIIVFEFYILLVNGKLNINKTFAFSEIYLKSEIL